MPAEETGRFARYRSQMAPLAPRSQPWRLLLGIILVILGQVLATVVIFGAWDLIGPGQVGRGPALISGVVEMLLLLATFSGFILGIVVAMRVIHRTSPGPILGPDGRFEWRAFWRTSLVLIAAGLALFAGSMLYESYAPNASPGLWIRWLPALAAVLLIQVFAEELVFRGYLQGHLAARYASPWIWLVIPALLFGAVHLPTAMAFGANAPLVLAVPTVIGLIAGHITARTGGLAVATGLHFANNLIGLAIVALPGPLGALALWHHDIDLADTATVTPMLLTNLAAILVLYAAYLFATRNGHRGLQRSGDMVK